MTKIELRIAYLKCMIALEQFSIMQGILIRDGEAYRPGMLTAMYAKTGVGILNSLHRKSFARDYWIVDANDNPIWEDARYDILGKYWKTLSHVGKYICMWGGDFKRIDKYHFEIRLV